jgi:hypothetical protein
MAFGDTVVVLSNEKKLKIKWDTGEVKEDKPVYYNQTIGVNNAMTSQEAYDVAYKLGTLLNYTVAGIDLDSSDALGPVA